MQSRYSGRCKGCNKPYAEGEDIYWTKEDGAWCWPCRENPKPSAEQYALADRLQYRYVSWQYLWGVHASIVDEPERDGSPSRERGGAESMPASTQGEE